MCHIQRAAGMPRQELLCQQWAKQFAAAKTASNYRSTLRSLMARHTSLSMSADWVRVQMQKVGRAGPLMPGAAAPKNSRLARKQEQQITKASAAATALVSAQRRRLGYTPGDRVSLEQLQKDVQRDRVRIEGHLLTATSVPEVVTTLSSTILARLHEKGLGPGTTRSGAGSGSGSGAGAGSGSGAGAGAGPRRSGAGAGGGAGSKFLEGRIMEFAHEVLRCSSRTIAGGDAYDALDLVFGNRDLVLLTPASSEAPPVDILVDWAHTLEMDSLQQVGAHTSASVEDGGSHSRQPSLQSDVSSVVLSGIAAAAAVAAAGGPPSPLLDSASASASVSGGERSPAPPSAAPAHMLTSLGSFSLSSSPGTPRRANAFAGATGFADGSGTPRSSDVENPLTKAGKAAKTPGKSRLRRPTKDTPSSAPKSSPPGLASATAGAAGSCTSPASDPLFTSDQGPLCVKVVTSMRYVVRSADPGDGSPEFVTPWAHVVASFSRTFPITSSPAGAVIDLRLDHVQGEDAWDKDEE